MSKIDFNFPNLTYILTYIKATLSLPLYSSPQ